MRLKCVSSRQVLEILDALRESESEAGRAGQGAMARGPVDWRERTWRALLSLRDTDASVAAVRPAEGPASREQENRAAIEKKREGALRIGPL